jgi:hypothetical protein
MLKQGQVHAGSLWLSFQDHPVNLPRLPVDNAGHDERQAIAGVFLALQIKCRDLALLAVDNLACQRIQELPSLGGPQKRIMESHLGYGTTRSLGC